MQKHAQSAIEFMILIGAVLFFFIIFLGSLQSQREQQVSEERDQWLKEVALTVVDEVNLAYTSSDGYTRSFTLPLTITGGGYAINLSEGVVYARTLDGKHALALPVANTSGTILLGQNTIHKENGTVYLNS